MSSHQHFYTTKSLGRAWLPSKREGWNFPQTPRKYDDNEGDYGHGRGRGHGYYNPNGDEDGDGYRHGDEDENEHENEDTSQWKIFPWKSPTSNGNEKARSISWRKRRRRRGEGGGGGIWSGFSDDDHGWLWLWLWSAITTRRTTTTTRSSSSSSSSKRFRWRRIHERIALGLCCFGVCLYLLAGRAGGGGGGGGDGLTENNKMAAMMMIAGGGDRGQRQRQQQQDLSEQEKRQLKTHNATWGDYAYVTYASSLDGLCNAAMLMEALSRLGTKAERVVLFPEYWDLLSPSSAQWGLLDKVEREYATRTRKIVSRQRVHEEADDEEKRARDERNVAVLAGFEMLEFKRVLVLDAGSTLLRGMDELFLLPEEDEGGNVIDVAAPRAYWKNAGKGGPYAVTDLNEGVALIRPSTTGLERIKQEMKRKSTNDRGVLSRVWGKSAMLLSHRPYTLLSKEFREDQHGPYLGVEGVWDSVRALAEAKVVLFGGEMVKPWERNGARREQVRPQCKTMVNGAEVRQDCGDRDVWDWLYADFAERRLSVCGMGVAD